MSCVLRVMSASDLARCPKKRSALEEGDDWEAFLHRGGLPASMFLLLLLAARCCCHLIFFMNLFCLQKDGGFCPPNFREGCTWNSWEKFSEKAFYFLFLVFHDRYFFIFLKRCILFTIILEIFSANATETVPNYTIFLRCFWVFEYLCS